MKNLENNTYRVEAFDILQLLFEEFNDHQIHGIIYFKNHINEEIFKKAIWISTEMFPLIKCKFVQGKGFLYWEQIQCTIDNLVKVIHSKNSRVDIDKFVLHKTNTYEGPQMAVYIVIDNEKDTVAIVMNHMLCDGAGFKEYMYLISSIYNSLQENQDYKPEIKNMDRRATQTLRSMTFKQKVHISLNPYKLSKQKSKKYFSLQGDESNPFIEKITMDFKQFNNIKKYAKDNGATINDVFLTTFFRVLNLYNHIEIATIPCAVDMRKYIPDRKSKGICNLVSNLFCEIDWNEEESFRHTLMKVKSSMDKEKGSNQCLNSIILLETALKVLPYEKATKLIKSKFSNPPIAFTNIGLIKKEKLYFNNSEVEDAFITGSIKYAPYFQLATTTFNDKVTFTIAFYGTNIDRKNIKDFLQQIVRHLQDVI